VRSGFALICSEAGVRLFIRSYETSFFTSPMHLAHIQTQVRHNHFMRKTHDCLMTNKPFNLNEIFPALFYTAQTQSEQAGSIRPLSFAYKGIEADQTGRFWCFRRGLKWQFADKTVL